MTFVHRFGSALNANLHFRPIVDGVFSRVLSVVEGAETEGARFREATALTDEIERKTPAALPVASEWPLFWRAEEAPPGPVLRPHNLCQRALGVGSDR